MSKHFDYPITKLLNYQISPPLETAPMILL